MAPMRASGRTNNPDKPVSKAFEQQDGDHQEEVKVTQNEANQTRQSRSDTF